MMLTKEMLEYNYTLHGSMQKMATALGISVDSIYKYMRLCGVDYAPHYKGIYTCNHNVFASDTEKSFYLAGFIAADGSLQGKKYSKVLKITLSIKDRAHLEMMRSLLGSDNPIKTYWVEPNECVKTRNQCVELQIVSKSIYTDLRRFNIVPNKTMVYSIPNWLLTHPNVNHFMRGYLDGDGTFSHCGLGKGRIVKQASFSMIGTERFVTQYRDILVANCNITPAKITKKKSIYATCYSGNNVLRDMASFLYKDATIYLPRKYDKIKHLLPI